MCGTCGAKLDGQLAWDILAASEAAAVSLEKRQALVDALPTAPDAAVAAAAAVPVAVAAPAVTVPAAAPATAGGVAANAVAPPGVPTIVLPSPPPTRTSGLSLQSVLAVAGAGLVAVAAIVFAFFNPDLDDANIRNLIIAACTVAFIGAAWLLARGGLQFSAEAVGALGTVFVGLDVWAVSELADTTRSAYVIAAVATLFAVAAVVALGVLVRLRSWIWVSLAALPLAPLFAGFAIDEGGRGRVVGFTAATAVALVVHPLLTRIGRRFDSEMNADHSTALIVQLLTAAGAILAIFAAPGDGAERAIGSAIALAVLAVIAALSARHLAAGWWSWASGALAASSLATLAFVPDVDPEWIAALAPVGALIAAGISGLIPARGKILPGLVRAGVWTIASLVALPGIVAMVPAVILGVLPYSSSGNLLPSTWATALMLGLLASAAAGVVLWLFGRRDAARPALVGIYLPVASWQIVAAVLLFVTWSSFLRPAQAVLALIAAVLISLALTLLPFARRARLGLRLPFIVGAHALIVIAGIISWQDEAFRVGLGAAGVASVVLLAMAMPRASRPLYTALGYSWALVILSSAFELANFELIAVLCLTTSVGALVALVATLAPWPRVAHWYAILAVTSVPFLIGVVTVFSVRSGWTGLSTSVIVALLLVIVLSRREGLTRLLRTGAAGLLLPALAVAIISLGAEFLSVSAAPITLPIIAAIIACVLPSTALIGAGLERLGVAEKDAKWSRIAIEISALVTAAFAIVLALVRAAAGLPTTLIVLVILGVGAIATAIFGRRRYGWLMAGISFTGALWCVWALNGITGLEPYLLPPTLAAAIVGFFLVARGLRGYGLSATGLYTAGLATALAPILVTQAAIGGAAADGTAGSDPWRTWLLLGLSIGLVAFSAAIPAIVRWKPLSRVGSLRTPSLVLGLVAAASGVVQSVRFGWSRDGALAGDENVMIPVLGYTVLATGLAIVIGVLTSIRSDAAWAAPERLTRSRWLFVPAVLFLVIGPIAAMRGGWLPIITLYAISLALLALMIVTAALARKRAVILPPVFLTFAAAWCAAVASWSARDLRVETYSLALGLSLLAVGVIAMWPQPEEKASLWTWPIGFSGSWRLLAPGIIVTLLPSILATGTDPRTERAILVIVLALIAIMIGNLRRLAAPFILGIIVLPIENIVVFAVQVGQNISSLPWWITLATAGAVLLVLAVTSERRVGKDKGTAARIRDLT